MWKRMAPTVTTRRESASQSACVISTYSKSGQSRPRLPLVGQPSTVTAAPQSGLQIRHPTCPRQYFGVPDALKLSGRPTHSVSGLAVAGCPSITLPGSPKAFGSGTE
ncbi:hypothetical protein IF1G_03851 [Cordyceps javanica]|uniref:Uncharacterized protein n=1 Tax=Cordyceps javanica TaxID=43265 RepID=A0A545V8Q6_9HYPO|nr:hypothetical protein IF1G_03851 [Cordyceps javanica]